MGERCHRDWCFIDNPEHASALTLTDLLEELEAILEQMIRHGCCYCSLTVAGAYDYFVQVAAFPDGELRAEAVSTSQAQNGCSRMPLSRWQIAALLQLGWRRPCPGSSSAPKTADDLVNFHRTANPEWLSPAPMFAELLVRTLVEVYGLRSPADLELRYGRVPRTRALQRA
jgi:hypothetical protein